MHLPLVAFDAAIAANRPQAAWGWGAAAAAPAAAASAPEPARASEALAEGEPFCWDEVIRRHDRRVVVALVARGIPLERAKELAQETWLRLLRQHRAGKLPELRLPGVAIRQGLFLARAEQRREGRRRSGRGRSLAQPPPDLERQVIARDQLRRIEQVLDRSSPSARRVFGCLYGREPLTPREAAQQLGLSVQRVRQIACELRKKMRRALEVDDE